LNVPARCDDYAVDYYAKQLMGLREAAERYYAVDLGDIRTRAELAADRNQLIAAQYAKLGEVSYKDYIDAVHVDLQQSLIGNGHIRLKSVLAQKKNYEHRVYLVGSFLCNSHIAEIIEDNGLGIVGDNLPESGRLQDSKVENKGDSHIYRTVSERVLRRRLSPTQNNFEKILNYDIDEINALQAEGVIYISQKYCEPYDYLYSIYKKKLDELHIPVLHLSLLDSQDEKRVTLSVEAFADTL
jgi:benzoyl-CoA reductase/2-hydroxyglutaryl-CoA dehydratase subunit BcrC/BadD/HgdB